MRRIFSAAAALVLALGVTVLGATVANADGPFSASGMPGYAYPGQLITMSGNLPAGDTLAPFDANGSDAHVTIPISGDNCPTEASESDQAWTCQFTIPTTGLNDNGLYDLDANYDDVDDNIQTINSTFTYYSIPSATLSITSSDSGPSVVGTAVSTLAGAPTGGEVAVSGAPDGSGTGGCDFEAPEHTSCSTTISGTGFMVAVVRQDFSNPEAHPFSAPLYFTIPDAPYVTDGVKNDDGTVTISGANGTENDTVRVVDDLGATTCNATVDGEGDWSCTSTTTLTGLRTYYAFQIDTKSADDYDGETEGGVYQTGTVSARSDTNEGDGSVQLWDGLTLPSIQYTFIPGGIVVAATPTGDATKAGTEFDWWSPGHDTTCGGAPAEEAEPFPTCDFCPSGATKDEGGAIDFTNVAEGTSTCTFENLAPGVWNPYSQQNTAYPASYEGDYYEGDDYEGDDGTWVDDYFVVPTPPEIVKATNNRNGTATVSGTGIATDVIHVVADGTANELCEATVAANGTWKCTTTKIASGSTTFRAYQEDRGAGKNDAILVDDSNIVYRSGGLSAVTANGAVVVISGSSTTPTTTTTPPPWTFNLSGIDLGNIHPGDTFTITATGLPAGATITTVIHSSPVTLGSGTVAPDGTFSQTVTIPSDIDPGAHQLILTMNGTGLTETSATQAVSIVPAKGGTVITTDPSKQDIGGTGGVGSTEHKGGTEPGDPTAPNILTRSINTIQDVVSHPGKISAAVAIGLVLLVFATIPARLLNATVAEQYENIVKRVPRLGRRPRWWERFTAWLKATPLAGGIALTAVTALLFGFADPNFGFNLASLRLIMGLAIALFIVEYLANVITGAILKRRLGLGVVLNLRPLGIILTIIGVIASRLLHFSPGFLIGLVLGLTLSGRTAAQNAWKAVMIRSSVVVGLGIVAWLGYSALTTGEEKTETFWTELFVEVLVAITTEGIVAILVELLPFRLLEGERLWHKNRWIWAASYFVVLVAFIVAVVPWEGNWEAFGSSLWIWITAVAVFFVICIGLYLYFRFASPFRETEEEHEEDPVEVGGGG